MLITLCRFVVFLSVFNCPAVALPLVTTDNGERTDNISKRSHDNRRVIGAEGSSLERGTIPASAGREVLQRLVFALSSEATESADRRIRRIRDVDTADGAGASIRKEGSALSQNSVLSSSTLDGFVSRHSKHRRRRRCKNRLGCSRFASRNGTAIERSDDNYEARNVDDHHPPRDRNFEKQLLLGNRSLELFRQELVASAATPKDPSPGHKLDPSSREIGDILADSRSRRPQGQPETLAPDISLWRTVKLVNGTLAASQSVGQRLLSATKYKKPEETELNGNLSSSKDEFGGLADRPVREKSASDKRLISATKYKRPQETELNGNVSNSKDESGSLADRPVREKSAIESPKNHRTESSEGMQYEFNLTEKEGALGWPSDDRRYELGRTAQAKGNGNVDSLPIDDRTVVHESLAALLSRLFDTLGNTTATGKSRALLRDLEATREWLDGENSSNDMCRKWLDSKDKLEEAFLGPIVYLPSCPCQYPSGIFYDDKVWDPKQEKYFRWRDVNSDAERMDVYKPGAAYCVRSLLTQGSGHAAAQHCCYDRQRRLLTRGSGAGTPNFVSPEISAELHERIDVLPWRLCKGDFSRFNKVRPPNNDNRCKTNPDDDEYRRQINYTKHY